MCYEARIGGSCGTYHDALDREAQPSRDRLRRTQSSTKLEPYRGRHLRREPADDAEIVTGAEGAIEIHDVYPSRPLLSEALRDHDGIVPINSLPRRLTLTEANDAAVSNVNGGKEIHYSALRQPPRRGFSGVLGDRVGLDPNVGRLAQEGEESVPLLFERRKVRRIDRRTPADLDPP